MSGMIGVISDHAARYTWFSQSLAHLYLPDRDLVRWSVGANRGESRNHLVRECLQNQCKWLFFIDDDQAFAPDTLTKLLAHNQPVVSALIVQRGAPFLPTAYASHVDGKFSPLDLRSVKPGLVVVAGVGTGALLVRAEVFEKIEPPWFVYTEDYGEDLYFSNLCEKADIQMLVDTACPVGHLIPAAVTAAWLGDRWGVGIQLSDGTLTTVEMRHS